MDPVLETLLQTGAIGLIAYLLIQYQREQARGHRESLAALLTQTTANLEAQARGHREEMRQLIENNAHAFATVADALQTFAAELDTLEDRIAELTHRAANGHNLAELKTLLCKQPKED